MNIKIRRGTIDDLGWMVEQGLAFLGTVEGEPYDPNHLPSVGLFLLDSGVVLIAETEEGERVGTLMAAKTTAFFDPAATIWQEVCWWIVPEHRQHGVGEGLLTAFEQVVGEDRAHLSTLPMTEVAHKFFERRGWRLQQLQWCR